jgi:HSP20 family protein
MNLRSLVPFRSNGNQGGADAGVFFGLRQFDQLFDELSRFRSSSLATNALVPRIDVTENDKEIEITAELPGLERKDVEISLEDNTLTIRAEKEFEEKKGDEKKHFHLTERSYGVFYRVLELPAGIDQSSIQATMSKGVLKLTIPKPARNEAKKIEIKDAA